MIEVVVYSKPDCCLCDEVKTKLARLKSKYPFDLREVNILDDPAAFTSFQDEIPVVFINGRLAFKWHLNEGEFIQRIAGLTTEGKSIAHAT